MKSQASWAAPELEPDRIWHPPEVIIYNHIIYPEVSCTARGYDVANRRWYELNIDSVVRNEDDWTSGLITKHIVGYHSKHNRLPDFNVINTTRQETPTSFEKKPYEHVARRIRGNVHYGRGEFDTLPTTTFDQAKQKIYLNASVDRCVWNSIDCVFKRIEFEEDLDVMKREITMRQQLLRAIEDDPAAGTTMQERFRILPILAAVNKHAATDEILGLVFPYGGKSLEDLAGGYKYGMGYDPERDEEEGSGEAQEIHKQDAPTGPLPFLSITEAHLQDLVIAVRELSRAGVLHGDINDRNTLLMPDNRLMFVDLGEIAPGYKGDAHALGSMMLWVLQRVDWDRVAMERVREIATFLQEKSKTEM